MNFQQIGLDLQGTMKLIYANLLYRSTYYDLLDSRYLGSLRTGMPIIEYILDNDTPLNVRKNIEIGDNGLKNSLATYNSVKVDLTELPMDYSFRISPVVLNSGIANAVDSQIQRKNAQIAKQIDIYGYNKMNTAITGPADGSMAYTDGQISKWAPTNGDEVINDLNNLKALLFDRDVYDGYYFALSSQFYAHVVSQLTSILKYETKAGVEGVDRGTIESAYGIEFIEVNSNVISKDEDKQDNNVVGYFGNEIAMVGDTFFSAFLDYPQGMPGFPGYYCLEGNLSFGSKIVRPEAIIKVVESIPTVDTGSFDEGQVGVEYNHTTEFSGTEVAKFEAGGLPAGLSLNPSDGKISGTPTEAGEYNVSIYGIDKYGNYSNAYNGTITIAAA